MRFVYRNSIIIPTMWDEKGGSTLTTHSAISSKTLEMMVTSLTAKPFWNKALKYLDQAVRTHRCNWISMNWYYDKAEED